MAASDRGEGELEVEWFCQVMPSHHQVSFKYDRELKLLPRFAPPNITTAKPGGYVAMVAW